MCVDWIYAITGCKVSNASQLINIILAFFFLGANLNGSCGGMCIIKDNPLHGNCARPQAKMIEMFVVVFLVCHLV